MNSVTLTAEEKKLGQPSAYVHYVIFTLELCGSGTGTSTVVAVNSDSSQNTREAFTAAKAALAPNGGAQTTVKTIRC